MNNPYYTHQPYLIQELEKLKDLPNVKILEFGVGDGSSAIFHEYALKYKNLQINAYETDGNWLNNMRDKYHLDNYIFNDVENWIDFLISDNFNDECDLIFIDQAPWEARIQTLDLIKNKSKVIILHDYDFYNHGLTSRIYDIGEGTFFEKYNDAFTLENHYNELPPTLIFRSNDL